jgi:hypothetical protein
MLQLSELVADFARLYPDSHSGKLARAMLQGEWKDDRHFARTVAAINADRRVTQ